VSTSADIHDIEQGLEFQPKFDASGLVTCVATDAGSGDVLMVAHMNDEALRRTIASGEAWYFSRSRNALWRKGETYGHVQRVVEMRLDCDQDAIWIRVEQSGAACHTGRRSCFYRAVTTGEGGMVSTSLAATGAWANGLHLAGVLAGNDSTERRDEEGWSNPFSNIYATQDGRFLMLALAAPKQEWPRLSNALGHPEWAFDPRFVDMRAALKNRHASPIAQRIQSGL